MDYDLSGFKYHVATNVVTRRDAEALVGREEVTRLIVAGVVVDNPITGRLELVRETEDFYP